MISKPLFPTRQRLFRNWCHASWCRIHLACVLFLFTQLVQGASTTDTPSGVDDAALPTEVIITGRKLFRTLEAEIRDAEDRMFGLFNEANDEDQYDIYCEWEKSLGTRIRQRICRPNFLVRATTDEAQYTHNRMLYLSDDPRYRPTTSFHTAGSQQEIGYHYPILEAKMRQILKENDQFLAAVIHHYELREQLTEAKTSFFGQEPE